VYLLTNETLVLLTSSKIERKCATKASIYREDYIDTDVIVKNEGEDGEDRREGKGRLSKAHFPAHPSIILIKSISILFHSVLM
jgi:hypothetical protein